MKKVLLGLVAVLACVAGARTFEVTAWRGETVAVRLPDFCELGEIPDGLSVRLGALKTVMYAPPGKTAGLERVFVYDRVSWRPGEDGPRVAEVSVSPNAKPGVYDCGRMRVTVIDRVLPSPKEWKFYLDLWQHPWAVARVAKAKPFSKEHYAAMKPVWELLATAGAKTITVPLLDQPWDHQCFDAYHSLVDDPDFKLFDEYVQFCLDCGLGPDISCYSLCPWTLGLTIDENELEKRWGAFLEKFAAHVKAKGWFEHTLMSMDERSPEDVEKVVRFVRRHAPGMRISMAGNLKLDLLKKEQIESYSQVLRADAVTPEFLAEAKARTAKGFQTTYYVCVIPGYPNTFMWSKPDEAYWLGASPSFLGLDGFLRWAWNSWPQNPKLDASFEDWAPGDTFLCYPDGEPSWRFLELRNGIVAAEKARILKEQGVLSTNDFAKVAALYDVKRAVENKCNFAEIRQKTQELVNRPK